ncbi:MAG TPA: arylsulfatase [Pyrinomonadaceae bacterium]|jgi:arylsulfatase A-like enzyme
MKRFRSLLKSSTAFIALLNLLFVSTVPAQKNKPATRQPNIILILADDLGYGDIGAFGQKFIRTPNLDKLAKDGIKFTNFYAGAPVCAPSRASLMTGKHQGHAIIRGNNNDQGERVPLRPADTTIAEVLKAAGYRTGIVGKWGLGEPETSGIPNRKGFDYFFGYLNQNHAHNYFPDYLWRNTEKVNLPKGAYSADLFAAEALDFVKRERENPFFLYLAVTLPHADNELNRKTGNGMEIPSDAPYSGENWTPQQKNYAAMVTRLDDEVGKLRDLLKQLKIDDNTIVIFTSDNGPQDKSEGGYDQTLFQSSGNLRGLKRELYEGGIREPLIIFWKNKIKPNQRSEKVWSQIDFLPTFAELAGTKFAGETDGISMARALYGKNAPAHEYLYWEFHEGGFAQAVRARNWKGVRKGLNGKIELYDLQKDVKETTDLSAKYPKIVAQIAEIMKREHVESENWSDKGSVNEKP